MILDQAENLRVAADNQKQYMSSAYDDMQRVYLVISGKGGVGKSFISLHLAQELAKQDQKVLLVDSNLQSPNLHVLTNIDPVYPISYWLQESSVIEKNAVVSISDNLDLLANESIANDSLANYLQNSHYFIEILNPLSNQYDFVVFDTQTGLNDWNLGLLQFAHLGLLVSSTDPASVIDSYTFIKAALPYLKRTKLGLVINQVFEKNSGIEAHRNLNLALKHFLNFETQLIGTIPFDMEVRRAGMEQKPVWQFVNSSPALKELAKITELIQTLKSIKEPIKSQIGR